MLVGVDINQGNLCNFAENGELEELKTICGYLDENGKNAKYNLDIAGHHPNYFSDNYAIRWACDNGKIDVVKYLMENWSHLIDIAAKNNYAIRYACYNGHILVVKYLMENWSHLIDITARANWAIRFAHMDGNINIVNYLIAVSIKKILDHGIETDDLNNIIKLLVC